MKSIVLLGIRFYQKTISLDHGPLNILKPLGQCKFYPTCSDYAYQAINKYGITKGIWLSFKRIIHCHPSSNGGIDELK